MAVILGLWAPTSVRGADPPHFRVRRTFSPTSKTWGASLADYDLDGRPDLFLSFHNSRRPVLLHNLSKLQFSRPAVPWVFPMDRHNCAWGEANGDGSPDLFCGQGARGGHGEGANELWSSNPWTEWAATAGVDNPLARARSINWLDYDRDGDLDILTTAIVRDELGIQLFRNDRGSFTPVDVGIPALQSIVLSAWADWDRDGWPDILLLESTAGSNLRAYRNDGGVFVPTRIQNSAGTWKSAAWGDYDGDGWPDLHLVGSGRSLVLHNVNGRFRPVSETRLTRGRASAWLDIDNDGLLDLYVVQTARGREPGPIGDRADRLLLQVRPGVFRKVALPETAGWPGAGDGVATGDVNGDQRVDVLVGNGRARWQGGHRLLINRTAGGKGASLLLIGTRWNPNAYGARIRIAVGQSRRWLTITDGVSGVSQSSAVQHVGLGRASSAVARVMWPGGRCDRVTLPAGKPTMLRIGSNPCR